MKPMIRPAVLPGTTSSRLAAQLKGLVLLVVVGTLICVAVLQYRKAFTPAVTVTLLTDRAGLQLNAHGDVRIHGALVGEVTEVTTDGAGARVSLRLEPEAAQEVPADVHATISPTTLFGQRYVALSIPEGSTAPAIGDGAVVPRSRTGTTIELNRALGSVHRLLRTVQPAELSATLNAVADALDGRGADMGRTLDLLDTYLAELNRHLPALRESVALLAPVTESYADAAPDLLAAMANSTVTARTVRASEAQLVALVDQVSRSARATRRFLDRHGEELIRLSRTGRPIVELLAEYSPQFPCLIEGLHEVEKVAITTMRHERLQALVEIGPQPDGYTAEDRPVYGDMGTGPQCRGLPDPQIPYPGYDHRDGATYTTEDPAHPENPFEQFYDRFLARSGGGDP